MFKKFLFPSYILLLYFASCSTFPMIIDNYAGGPIHIDFKLKEDKGIHEKIWNKNGIYSIRLPSDLMEQCDNSKSESVNTKVVYSSFRITIPPNTRVCIPIANSPENIFESVTMDANKESKSVLSRFKYFRTSYDTIGYSFRYPTED